MKKWPIIFLLTLVGGMCLPAPAAAEANTYYVSASGGNDSYNGLSESQPFRTLAKVNSLSLLPGDRVLFKCGDTWRAEQLVISHSGNEGAPILFGAYPDGCANLPVLSGSNLADNRLSPGAQPAFPQRRPTEAGPLAQPGRRQRRLFVRGWAFRRQQPDQRQRAARRDRLDGGHHPHQEHPLVDARPAGDGLQRHEPHPQHGAIVPDLQLGDVRWLGLFHQ
jgi:hypothetical protein